MSETRPPLPPFTRETAAQKVRMAEDAWNKRDPERVSLGYAEQSRWRNRSEFPIGRKEIVEFLQRKWAKELDYRLIKELWAFTDNRIAVRYAYEWHDDSGQWFRSYGNENWEFGRRRPDGTSLFEHQRSADFGARPEVPLAAWAPPGRSSGTIRPRALGPLQLPQTRNAVANCRFIADP